MIKSLTKHAHNSSLPRQLWPESATQIWQLQSAKARFSEVFRLARSEGPQLITRQGKDGVVILPVEQFEELVNRSQQKKKSVAQFFRESPLVGLKLDLNRDKDPGRDIEL